MSALAAAAAKTPFIDWTALGKVAGVSLIFGVAVVVLFSLGIVGLSMARGNDTGEGPVSAGNSRVAGSLLAGVCFVVCAGAVLYGLYLIIPQFH
jgi:hypothetical protein